MQEHKEKKPRAEQCVSRTAHWQDWVRFSCSMPFLSRLDTDFLTHDSRERFSWVYQPKGTVRSMRDSLSSPLHVNC